MLHQMCMIFLWEAMKYDILKNSFFLKKFLNCFSPHNESQCGAMLFWIILTFIIWTKRVETLLIYYFLCIKESHTHKLDKIA